MFTFIRIAWRNLWRNPRRSGVVIAAMAVGLWGMLFALGFGYGMGSQMIDNIVNSYLGHLQIHHRKFPARIEGMSLGIFQLDYTIPNPDQVRKVVSENPLVKGWSPRLKVMGLITNAEKAGGVAILGIEPQREASVTIISKSIVSGGDLRPGNPRDILVGKALADKMRVDVGSKVVLMTQDIKKQKAVSAFVIVGLYKTSTSDFDKTMVYVNLVALQDMCGMSGEINEIVMLVTNYREQLDVAQMELQPKIGPDAEVIQWKQVWPMLYRMVGLFDVWTFITFVLVFVAMAFGIANAVLMAIFERIRELGIMKALGTKPGEIFITVAIECFCLSLVGVIIGTALGWGTVFYYSKVGMNLAEFSNVLDAMGLGSVVYLKMRPTYIVWGALTTFTTALLSSLWPAIKAARLLPVEAIHHV